MRTWQACLALILSFANIGSAQDHLVPDASVFVDPDSYLLKARQVFIQAFDDDVVLRALVLPSRGNEFSVGVLVKGELVEAFVLEPSSNIWQTELLDNCLNEINEFKKDGEKVPENLINTLKDLKKHAVDFRTIKATRRSRPLPKERAEEIRTIWKKMLLDVRHPKEPENGLDGVAYHFSGFFMGWGEISGQTWSPSEGSKTERLTMLAEAIGNYARGKCDLAALAKTIKQAQASMNP